MQFGSLQLKSNLFLSPLAGYTNLPFRLTLREIGGLDLATTDLVNARSLLEKNPKALKLIETNPADRPLAVQFFGSVPEEMRDAAVYLESLGISSVDINMGCPVRKVCRIGGGAAMMTEWDKTARLVRGMVEAVKIPVTAKMRLGWDDANLTAPDLARVSGRRRRGGDFCPWPHPRTGFFRHGQPRRHPRCRAVRRPSLSSATATSPRPRPPKKCSTRPAAPASASAAARFTSPGFSGIRTFSAPANCCRNLALKNALRVMRRHLGWMAEVFGETHGCRMFRKVGPWYAKRFGPANEFNKRIVRLSSRRRIPGDFGHLSPLAHAIPGWRAAS